MCFLTLYDYYLQLYTKVGPLVALHGLLISVSMCTFSTESTLRHILMHNYCFNLFKKVAYAKVTAHI